MEIDRLINVLQACLDSGYREVRLVTKHPDLRHRIEYEVARIACVSPVVFIHAEDE